MRSIRFVFGVFAFLAGATPCFAQSALGSATGTSSIDLDKNSHSYIQLNFAQSAFAVAYSNAEASTGHLHWNPSFGMQLSVKPSGTTSNTVSLLTQSGVSASGNLIGSVSFANIFTHRLEASDKLKSDISTATAGLRAVMLRLLKPDISSTDLGKEANNANVETGRIVKLLPKSGLSTTDLTRNIQELESLGRIIMGQFQIVKDTEASKQKQAIVDAQRVILQEWNTVDLSAIAKFPLAGTGPAGLTWDTLTFHAGYTRDQYKLLNRTAAFAKQIVTQAFNGWSTTVDYNAEFNPAGGPIIFCISGGVAQRNNSQSLPSLTVIDETFTSTSGGTTRIGGKSQTVLGGTYSVATGGTLAADFIWKPLGVDPAARFGIDLFTRSNYANHLLFNPGVALFLSPKNSPLAVNQSIAIVQTDKNKWALELVAGYNF